MIRIWEWYVRIWNCHWRSSNWWYWQSCWHRSRGHCGSRCSTRVPIHPLSEVAWNCWWGGCQHSMYWKWQANLADFLPARSILTQSFQLPGRKTQLGSLPRYPISQRFGPWAEERVLTGLARCSTSRRCDSSAEQRCWRSFRLCSCIESDVLDDNIIERAVLPHSALDKLVKIVDVGLVVLAVVIVEGLNWYSLAECGLAVREFWQFEAHSKKR